MKPEYPTPRDNEVRVFVVDDEPDILRFIWKCLAREGFNVETCADPLLAASVIECRDYDAILLDLKMPGMNGISLLKHIKEIQPQAEAILMTGYATVDTAVRSMKLGAFDYLAKPFDARELVGIVRRALQHHGNANDPNRFRDWDKMKEEFLCNTSHELRTPLTSIKSASRMLIDSMSETGRKIPGVVPAKMLDIIDRNSDRMIRLIDDLLDVYRYDKKKVNLDRIPISLNKLAAECVEDFTAPCQERGLTLAQDLQEGLPSVEADPLKIRQVLLNLVGNAMKFTPSGGKITIGTRGWSDGAQSSGAEIFVKDTGAGIPEDQQRKVFDKFYQADGSASRGKPGLGLGLALVKAIAEAHGGGIFLNSVPGRGSTFAIRLPTSFPAPENSHV